jgi:hypothetical protein
MQKNCTEFIAYENVVPDRGRPQKPARGERPRAAGSQSIEQAVPLVRRALKVLTDREVSPQLGLLKSTLLQLDSSFSERDYGVSTFREFADKLAQHGLVAFKQQGRSILVELPGSDGVNEPATPATEPDTTPLREILEQPDSGPAPAEMSLGDGVALVRRILADGTASPRWPMYPRQFKQFLKNAQPDFDERRYGTINDLMRACQKDGLLRLERDRQGGLRVFAAGATSRASVPHGWGIGERENGDAPASGANGHGAETAIDVERERAREAEPLTPVIAEPVADPVIDAQVTTVIEESPAAPRAKRSRKTAPSEKKKTAPRKKKQA